MGSNNHRITLGRYALALKKHATWDTLPLVQPARGLELPLLDPQLRRKVELVTANLLDEALGILAADERLMGSGKSGERASSTTE